MDRNFYFRKVAEAVVGSANFSSLISSSPTTYNLTAAQATSFAALNTALQSAYTASETPNTRTRVAIEARDVAMTNMRNVAKLYAKIIYATPTVTDNQLTALGLLPRTSRAPVPFPTSLPVVHAVSVGGRIVKIRIENPGEETRRGKPSGVAGVNIYTFAGENPPADVTEYKFQGMTTRMITELLFPNSVESGTTIWISACWVGTRGEVGVGSTPVSFTLLGGNAAPGRIAA